MVPKETTPMIKITVESVRLDFDGSFSNCYGRQEIIRCHPQSDRQIVTLSKAIMGWTGVVCRREDMGDMIRLKQPNTTLALDIGIQYL